MMLSMVPNRLDTNPDAVSHSPLPMLSTRSMVALIPFQASETPDVSPAHAAFSRPAFMSVNAWVTWAAGLVMKLRTSLSFVLTVSKEDVANSLMTANLSVSQSMPEVTSPLILSNTESTSIP